MFQCRDPSSSLNDEGKTSQSRELTSPDLDFTPDVDIYLTEKRSVNFTTREPEVLEIGILVVGVDLISIQNPKVLFSAALKKSQLGHVESYND